MKTKTKFIYILLISLLGIICLVVISKLFIYKSDVNKATVNGDKEHLQENKKQSIGNNAVDFQKYQNTMSVEEDATCQKYKEKALDDYKKGKMKFYYFGIAYPTKEFCDEMKSHNIEVISKNCIPEPELLCYNETILKLVGEN